MTKHEILVPALLLAACIPAASQAIPKFETYFGYSYIQFNPGDTIPSFHANGGTAQAVYNFGPMLGIVGDFGGYHTGNGNAVLFDRTMANFQLGPRVSFFKKKRFSPYVQALFGGVWTSSPSFGDIAPPRLTGSETEFAMLAGGGLNVRLSHRFALRPFEVDYLLTRGINPIFDTIGNQNNLRVTAGISVMFGGEKPTPQASRQVSKTCPNGVVVPEGSPCPKMNLSVNLQTARAEICQGETVSLSPTLSGNHGGVALTWTVNGSPVAQTPGFDFGSNAAPGTYRVGVTAKGADYVPASSEVAITVKEYQAPNGTVQADPAEVYVGQKSTLAASFQGQCGGPIQQPVFSATEGAVQGNEFDSSGVQFDPSVHTEQRKAVTITASAADSRNTGTASTTVTVISKASAAAIRLPDILFPANSARVNNCGKRVLLEQLRSYFERDAGGKAVLIGHTASGEPARLAEERTQNAVALITAATDICLSIPPNQVLYSAPGADQGGVDFQPNFCGPSAQEGPTAERRGQTVSTNDANAKYRRVVVWFVPSGGQLPDGAASFSTATANLSCPK
jgi:hypothetical protein